MLFNTSCFYGRSPADSKSFKRNETLLNDIEKKKKNENRLPTLQPMLKVSLRQGTVLTAKAIITDC